MPRALCGRVRRGHSRVLGRSATWAVDQLRRCLRSRGLPQNCARPRRRSTSFHGLRGLRAIGGDWRGSAASAPGQVLLRRQVGRSPRTRSRSGALLRRCGGPTLNARITALGAASGRASHTAHAPRQAPARSACHVLRLSRSPRSKVLRPATSPRQGVRHVFASSQLGSLRTARGTRSCHARGAHALRSAPVAPACREPPRCGFPQASRAR
jgi:hypothetical protein